MDSITPRPRKFVDVVTTLPAIPLVAHNLRQPIVTERLICRPHAEEDLEALYALRSQEEVMRWSPTGLADKDINETKKKLALALPPRDAETFNFAICLRETGEFIGEGGTSSRSSSLGWPAMGYKLRKEYWGQGLATEFVNAFLKAYWALPRAQCHVKVDKEVTFSYCTARDDEGNIVLGNESEECESARELLIALTVPENIASCKVLEKSGFQLLRIWEEQDMRDPSVQVKLLGFAIPRPELLKA